MEVNPWLGVRPGVLAAASVVDRTGGAACACELTGGAVRALT